MTKLIAAFCNFANASKNSAHYTYNIIKPHLPSNQKVAIIIGCILMITIIIIIIITNL